MKLRNLIKKFERASRLEIFAGSTDPEDMEEIREDYVEVSKELVQRIKDINKQVDSLLDTNPNDKDLQRLKELV